MISGLAHVSIAVPSLDEAAARLKSLYGLVVGPVRTNEEQGVRVAYVELGNARIELMEPARPDSSVARFLERNPKGGIHHFSLAVDSVDAAAEALRGRGARVIGAPGARNVDGERIAFVHPQDFLGALVELEEHK